MVEGRRRLHRHFHNSRRASNLTEVEESFSPKKLSMQTKGRQEFGVLDKALTKFQLTLDRYGIQYKSNRRSIIIKECPSCHKQWKVWMFRPDPKNGGGMTGGQCWRCGTAFSSFSLISQITGRPAKEILDCLGANRVTAEDLAPEAWEIPDFFSCKELLHLEERVKEIDIPSNLMTVGSYLEHPASIYARKRGIIAPLSDSIFIDPLTQSVAFPILCKDLLVGFQRRYVAPLDPNVRMRTDAGVPRGSSFIFVGNPEDPICVVEGPFDAVAAAWFGFFGIATMGKEITRSQAQEIASYAIENTKEGLVPVVHIGLDSDSAGEEGARALARYLDAYGITFCRVFPQEPGIKDFNDLLLKIVSPLELDSMVRIDPKGIIKFKRDWAWDLPMIGDIDFFKFVSPVTNGKIIEKARKLDKTVTNDYTWEELKNPEFRKRVRQLNETNPK